MKRMITSRIAMMTACGTLAVGAVAEPVTYEVDSSHTYPSFEADHWAGLSVWRGKIKNTSGTIVLDREAEAGTVEVVMDMASIDFGHDGMNEHAMAPDILDVAQFPTATYVGELTDFVDGEPTAVLGSLTMHGVTRPVTLTVNQFRCQPHFRQPFEVCGADARATILRDEFGVDYDKENGFFMEVYLQITVEARTPL